MRKEDINYIGQRFILVRQERKQDAYVDQFGVKQPGYVCTDPYAVEIVHQRLAWAVPDYNGKPYEPYGKVWHLIAHGGGREFTCTQNWDGGATNLWSCDGITFWKYGDVRSGKPAVQANGEPFIVNPALLDWVERKGEDLIPTETEVNVNGIIYQRNVSRRCLNIDRHHEGPGCSCHPNIPEPCPNCYAIETLSRKVPWHWTGRMRQEGAQG